MHVKQQDRQAEPVSRRADKFIVPDFSPIVIPSKISAVPAEKEIGIFAVSAHSADRIIVKEENFCRAADVQTAAGYE